MIKDYWVLCSRNLVALAFLLFIYFLLILNSVRNFDLGLMFIGLMVILLVLLSRMFRQKAPRAIVFSYIVFGAFLVLRIVSDILEPSLFGLSRVLAYVILIYILYGIYQAQKQKVIQ